MQRLTLLTLFSIAFVCLLQAQQPPPVHCGQQEVTEKLLRENPVLKRYQETAEQQLRQYNAVRKQTPATAQRTTAAVTLPVVVHIIHNNGAENISDAQVLAGIQHLNEAFANTGYYDPANGVNTQIQFCLAQRDPNNNPTNGITRNVSSLTVMGGPNYYSDDLAVKNLNRWNPACYINIWLVRSIPGNVAGYAYLPSAHGSAVDGILMESTYFGSSPANSVVTIHEMGHYLGLYHTFEGACKNDDCTADGDKVCDTPPDQSTASTSCNTTINSCSTDALSGFGTDVDDLKEDYMDYGNFDCMKVFTQGQADRMNWFIQNTRNSLLQCKSCMIPCPAPVTAGFTTSATAVSVGATVTFTNSSVNAASYRWYINNALQSTAINYAPTFNTAGTYTIKMVAASSDPLCDSAFKTETITVTCPLTISFTPPDTVIAVNTTLTFLNATTGATSYSWQLNGVTQSTSLNFTQAFTTPGNYAIQLKASNGFCTDSLTRTVVVAGACQQQTFQRTYGGQRNDIISDIRSTPDGGYIVAGRTASFGGGDEDGFLMKIDQLGAVQWSQTYGASRTDGFYRAILTSDGGYMAVGQTKSYGYLTGAAWVVKTDASGTIQWNRQFGENSTYGEIASNVIEASDGSYYITGRQNNNPGVGNVLVIKLDIAGSLLWSKVYDDSDSDNGSSIMEDNGGILVSGTSRSATWHDAYLMKLDPANGNVFWSKKYDVDGRNNAAGAAFTRQGNHYLMPLVTINDFANTNTGRAMMLRIDLNGDAVEVKEIIAPDYVYGSTGTFMPTPDGGYLFQQSEDLVPDADLNLIKLNPAGAVEWTRKFTQPGNQYNYTLRLTPDGGYISAGYTTTGGNDMYIVKTDALGNIPACNTSTVQVQVNTPIFTTNPFTWDGIRNSSFTTVPHPVLQARPATIPSTLLCAGGPCTTLPADTCNIPTFTKQYDFPLTAIVETPDQNIYGIGNLPFDPANSNIGTGIISKLDKSGVPVWNKYFTEFNVGNKPVLFNDLCLTQDQKLAIVGNSFDPTTQQSFFHFIKADTNGTLLFQKKWALPHTKISVKAVAQAGDKSYFSLIHFDRYPQKDWFVIIKTDENGNLLWARRYEMTAQLIPSRLIITTNALFVASAQYGNGPLHTILTKIDQTNGVIMLLRQYRFNNADTYFEQSALFNNSTDLLISGRTVTNGKNKPFLLRLTEIGNIIQLTEFNQPALGHEFLVHVDKNDDILLGNAYSAGSPAITGTVLARVNGSFAVQWSRSFLNPANYPDGLYKVLNAANTGILAAGIHNYAPGGWPISTLGRYTNDGHLPCLSEQLDLLPATITGVPGAVTIPVIDVVALTPVTNSPVLTDALTRTLYTGCTAFSQCDSVGIEKKDTVCSLADTVIIRAAKNNGCLNAVEWEIDPTYAKIIKTTDSTISLQFLRTGTITLYARITTSCRLHQDSTVIHIMSSPDTVTLGPDVQLCTNSTYTLHAGPGFRSYQWQDGSTDSTFTAYNPGMYHVLATDYCGNAYRDTVIITQAPTPPFDLGPDLERCSNDTLQLTAPAGFTNYRWSGNYMISSIYGQTVRLYTDQDTLYSVTAEKGPGCIVIDTIRVKIKPTAPLNLGNDTSFCQNKSIVLDAGPGFSNYTWNTGANSQQVTIATAGNFHVSATNANGCISKDTLVVTNVFALPIVNLGRDTIVCANGSIAFHAGAGFAAYQWQDGSTGAAFTATQAGVYWVRVTDQHTCINSDTVAITDVKAPPANFLPDTAQLCDWQRLELKPSTTFKQYQWYNNATTSAITITAPGIYWLKATNSFGCTGADSIKVVAKDCLKGLYLPNAFSPNNDRNNDVFRPTVYGYPEKYRLTVYNRWGQRIFETIDINKGWDGTINGKPQDTGMFVWTCQYKLAGMEEKKEKGVLTLVR